MKFGDWVESPQGFAVIGHITSDGKNAYLCGHLTRDMFACAVSLLKPIDPAVLDILIAVNNHKERERVNHGII